MYGQTSTFTMCSAQLSGTELSSMWYDGPDLSNPPEYRVHWGIETDHRKNVCAHRSRRNSQWSGGGTSKLRLTHLAEVLSTQNQPQSGELPRR